MWKSKYIGLTLALTAGLAATPPLLSAEDTEVTNPVIIELFTSQGCSSCPPADRILRRLVSSDDPNIIPLSYHVDYWNYIGWTDPFSSERWSERQTGYAHKVFNTNRIYTPQVIVNGLTECVGSNERLVNQHIRQAKKHAADGQLKLEVAQGEGDSHLSLAIEAQIRNEAPDQEWNVMVAVFENDLVTPVESGENGGRTIKNSGVVRSLEKVFSLPARAGSQRSKQVEIEFEEGWKRSNLGVAVFLQDPRSLVIHGAAVRHLQG